MNVQGPDGTVTSFPDGTDAATIDQVMRQNFAPKQPAAAPAATSAAPAPTAPAAAPSSAAPQGWGDYMLQHLSSLGSTAGAASRAIDDYLTFGYADRLRAAMPSVAQPSLEQLRQQTAAAHQALGPIADPALGAATYLAGPAGVKALNLAGRLAPAGAGLARTIGASALEGAGAGALTAAGHGDDPLTGGVVGGVAGGVAAPVASGLANLGARGVTGVANLYGRATGALDTPASVTAATKAAREAVYNQAKTIEYDPLDVYRPVQAMKQDYNTNFDPNGATWLHSPSTQTELAKLTKLVSTAGAPTTHDLLTSVQQFEKIGEKDTPDGASARFFANRLDNIMRNVNPATPGVTAAHVDDLLNRADAAHAIYKNASWLEQAAQNLPVASPASEAAQTAMKFYNPARQGPGVQPQWDALVKIAQAGGGGGVTPWGLTHLGEHFIEPMVGAIAGSGHIPGAIAAGLTYAGMKPAASAILKRGERQAVQSALTQAYPALTGSATAYTSPDLSPAVRALLFGGLGLGQPRQ